MIELLYCSKWIVLYVDNLPRVISYRFHFMEVVEVIAFSSEPTPSSELLWSNFLYLQSNED